MKHHAITLLIISAALMAIVGCSAFAPEPAYNPSPMDGATGVLAGIDLAWTGPEGATFTVYFGTSSSFGAPVAEGLTTDFYDPAPLDDLTAGQTYFWRVDSIVGGTLLEGEVWSFTLAP